MWPAVSSQFFLSLPRTHELSINVHVFPLPSCSLVVGSSWSDISNRRLLCYVTSYPERRAFPLQVDSCSLTFPGYTTLTTTQYTVLETAEPIHADNAQMLGLDSSASHQWHMVHSRRRLSSLQPFSTPTNAFSPKTKPRINYLLKLNAESYFL